MYDDSIASRFWSKVDIRSTDECWPWLASTINGGYGQFAVGTRENRRGSTAHRFAYELAKGPIPEGYEIHHTCQNIGCVNPGHLKALTAAEHAATKNFFSGPRPRKTHCKHGHEFTPENTHVNRDGSRRCRECHRIRQSGFPTRQRAYGPVRKNRH